MRSLERASVTAMRSRPRADVLIIGGGINGLATFRDLALQGVDVALVERDDFLAGASGASSHMIHGGIRYLENGEFRLVNESVHERNRLLKNARHYVQPLRTTIPIYSLFSGAMSAPLRFLTHQQGTPKERGAALIKMGLILYDFFSRDNGAIPRHEVHNRRKSLAELPQLNPRLKYTATYFDASVQEPERLGLDVLADGIAAGGCAARATNYTEAVGLADGGVILRDRETGTEFAFTAAVIVNASGAWTDLTNRAIGSPTTLMGGTKGSQIVLEHQELFDACAGREMFFENDDGRIVLIQPIKGRVLVGTTDLDADPASPSVCTEAEVEYFFELISHVFPRIEVARSHIVYRFSGIRPLPRHEDTRPGFVSRDYNIVTGSLAGEPDTPVLSLVGGKWTTFRALGEQLSNRVLAALGKRRIVSTADLAIGGGAGYPITANARRDWIGMHRDTLPADRVDVLLSRYGTRATAVIDEIIASNDAPLATDPTFSSAEIRYLADSEAVVHLSDVVLRRTNHAFTGSVSMELLEELARLVAEVTGWNDERIEEEVSGTADLLSELHGVRIPRLVVKSSSR